MSVRHIVTSAAIALLWAAGAHAQSSDCKNPKKIYLDPSVSSERSVEIKTVGGSICLKITFDAARYTTQPEALQLPALTSGPAGLPTGFKAPSIAATPKDTFTSETMAVETIQTALLQQEQSNRNVEGSIDVYLADLSAKIGQSHGSLAEDADFKKLVDNAKGYASTKVLDKESNASVALSAEEAKWKTEDQLLAELQVIQAGVKSLPQPPPDNTAPPACDKDNVGTWRQWDACYDASYKQLQSEIAGLIAEATEWASGGSNTLQFQHKVSLIQYWIDFLPTLTDGAFAVEEQVTCTAFSRTRQITLKMADRMSLFSFQRPQSTDAILITVHCPSPLAVSAGASFNFRENRKFGVVQSQPQPGGTTAIDTFGETSVSKVNPYFIVMGHVHVYGPAYFSFGAGPSINDAASGGTSAEFLVGPTWRQHWIFVTAGVDIKKLSSLSGNFTITEMVPSNVTNPPLRSAYEPGFGLAITFTKP